MSLIVGNDEPVWIPKLGYKSIKVYVGESGTQVLLTEMHSHQLKEEIGLIS